MPTVFASVSVTIVFFYLLTLAMAYFHWLPVGLHMLWGFFMAILVVLLQCLIFGFFIGSGKSIKRVVEENGLSGQWIQKTRDYKNRCYPMLMAAIVVSVVAAVTGGGVSTGALPVGVHQALVWSALGLNVYSLWISYRVIVENVNAIHRINEEVASRGVSRPQPAVPPVEKKEGVPGRTRPGPASKFYFLAAAVWVPYLYMKFSLGSRTFPFWPFLALSGLCLLAGWLGSRKTPA